MSGREPSELALALPILTVLALSYVLFFVSGNALVIVLLMIAACITVTAFQGRFLRRRR
jgi:hypothetical protein